MGDPLLLFAVFCAGAFSGGFASAVWGEVRADRTKATVECTVIEELVFRGNRATMRATAGTFEEARAIIQQAKTALGLNHVR